MKKTMLMILLVLLGALGFTSTVQAATCSDVVYTDALLASNPNIGDACLEIIEEEEVSILKLRAKVVRQSVNSTIVQWQLPDGSWTEPNRAWPPYGATARIDGKDVRIADLAPKQEVNVYIISEGNFEIVEASAPPPRRAAAAPAPAPRKAASAPAPEPKPRALPKTATQVPMFALLGGLLILLGGAVSFVRTRL